MAKQTWKIKGRLCVKENETGEGKKTRPLSNVLALPYDSWGQCYSAELISYDKIAENVPVSPNDGQLQKRAVSHDFNERKCD